MRKSHCKIVCSFCGEEFWSLPRFYAHIRVCEKRKEWKYQKPCWETSLQGGKTKGGKRNDSSEISENGIKS